MAVGATGTISYNGVTFDGYVRSRVTITPQRDEADRTTVYNRYLFDIEGFASVSGDTTDNTLQDMRQKLTATGQEFHYDAKGMGDSFGINQRGGAYDVCNGPKPKLLRYDPIGNNRSASVHWQCEVCVPDCTAAKYQSAILALNFEVSYDIREDGLQTVSISGYAEIPLTRWDGSRKVLDAADRVREQIRPQVPLGFRRKVQRFNLSKDKRRMDFSFVDDEMDYPLPSGVVRMDVEHSIRSALNKGFMVWHSSISGSVTIAPGRPKTDAYVKFMQVCLGRIAVARIGAPQAGSVMLSSVSIRESIFERVSHFSIDYTIFKTSLAEILRVAGMWRPVPGTSWTQWRQSLEDSAFHVRGFSKLGFRSSDDVIIDLCGGEPKPPSQQPNPGAGGGIEGAAGVGIVAQAAIAGAVAWIKADIRLEADEDDCIAVHKPLTGAVGTKEIVGDFQIMEGIAAGAAGGAKPGASAKVPDIVQRVSAPSIRVRLRGELIRAIHQIPLPMLRSIGGVVPIMARQWFSSGKAGNISGSAIPIFHTVFVQEYILPTPPSSYGVPADPAWNVPPVTEPSAASLAGSSAGAGAAGGIMGALPAPSQNQPSN